MKRLALVLAVLAVAATGALVVRKVIEDHPDALVIVHWSNSHLTRDTLLPDMAERFNSEHHRTSSGRPIEVVVVQCDSAVQADDLVDRIKSGRPGSQPCTQDGVPSAAPTIITPQSGDWLVDINRDAGQVVDVDGAQHIAETWLGIVTYREMAACLGWPRVELGYEDIITLASDERGWGAHDCAHWEWGRHPLLAFTNPKTSTSGRNVLISLYAMAADKKPVDLTLADVQRPDVVQFVRDFQGFVSHYMPGTIALNTKVTQGSRYGQFFLMPEDNLASLYRGGERSIGADGKPQQAQAPPDLVMIYPKEGSVLNANPAAVVTAPWVTTDHADAAKKWIAYLLADRQQQTFVDAGFRPPAESHASIDAQQFDRWGLSAEAPTATLQPEDLRGDVLEQIVNSWDQVRPPAIVTFVVDVSGSMDGTPLTKVRDGLLRVLDSMSNPANPGGDNQVGLVTFSDGIVASVPPKPLSKGGFDLYDVVNAMTADGGTALYDAVAAGVELSDSAAGVPRATRAVVVLSDGAANTGGLCLDDLVSMRSATEVEIQHYCGRGDTASDVEGKAVTVERISGVELTLPHTHEVQVFFVGFSEADVQVGRILAEATGAEYQGSTEEDLANVIDAVSGYF